MGCRCGEVDSASWEYCTARYLCAHMPVAGLAAFVDLVPPPISTESPSVEVSLSRAKPGG